jgi:hypothetical protein
VAAALTPGLAVLSVLAPTRLGQLADPVGLWAWLRVTGLPSLAAGASTSASQSRCGQPGAHATGRGWPGSGEQVGDPVEAQMASRGRPSRRPACAGGPPGW